MKNIAWVHFINEGTHFSKILKAFPEFKCGRFIKNGKIQ